MIMADENKSYNNIPQSEKEAKIHVVDQNNIDKEKYFGKKKKTNKCVLITTYLLIILPTLLYAIVVVPIYSSVGMIILYVLLAKVLGITLFTLFLVSTSNPGYLPHSTITKEEHEALNLQITIALNKTVPLKYCNSCQITRPHRSFHCDICGNCVSKHDHHCPFVDNCIGEKNTGKFFIFILSTLGLSVYVLVSTIIAFIRLMDLLNNWNYQMIICIIVIFYSGVAFISTLVMFLMQCCFISKGITTNECMRSTSDLSIYNEGCANNWKNAFNCR